MKRKPLPFILAATGLLILGLCLILFQEPTPRRVPLPPMPAPIAEQCSTVCSYGGCQTYCAPL
jgi:hypothetical protein